MQEGRVYQEYLPEKIGEQFSKVHCVYSSRCDDRDILLSLEALHSDLDSFKADSQKAFASVSEARAVVTDIRDLKTSIAAALQGQYAYIFLGNGGVP